MNLGKTTSSRLVFAGAIAIAALVAAASTSIAQGIHLDSAGARSGLWDAGAGSDFHQAEGFVNWDLPWDWDLGSFWQLRSRADASLGWLGESGADAAIVTLGPSLVLGRPRLPFSLEGGVSPTILSRADFKSRDFGIPFQFTSHVALNLDIISRIRLSYRFQHMSNAGLGRHNPGLNMHMFGLSYLF